MLYHSVLLALAAYAVQLSGVVSLVELTGTPSVMSGSVGVVVYAICSFLRIEVSRLPSDRRVRTVTHLNALRTSPLRCRCHAYNEQEVLSTSQSA